MCPSGATCRPVDLFQ